MEYRATKKWLVALAQQLVANSSLKRNQGIYVRINIDAQNFGYEKDGNTYHEEWERHEAKTLHYIIVYPHKVFVAVTEGRWFFKEIPSPAEFKNTSNHDSCWREDGLSDIWEEAMESYDNCYGHVPDEHKDAPVEANIWTSPLGHSNLFQFVEVELGDKTDSYHYSLKSIKKLNYKIELEG